MSENDKAAFTAQDMKAVRLLAVSLGVITCAECFVAKSTEMLVLVIGLNVVMMVACPLAIYALRRARLRR